MSRMTACSIECRKLQKNEGKDQPGKEIFGSSPDESSLDEENLPAENRRGDDTCESLGDNGKKAQLEIEEPVFQAYLEARCR